MNSKSTTLSLFVSTFALFAGANSVVAFEPIPTLEKLRNEAYSYSPTTPFSLLEKSGDGLFEVNLGGNLYYFSPGEDELAKKLASTPATNLIGVDEENAQFEYNGKYYAFNYDAIPSSRYHIVEATSEDKHFTIPKLDENDELVEEFYKFVFSDGEGVAYVDDSFDISIEEIGKDSTNTFSINLPNNDTKYFQYAYALRDERPTLNIRQDSLVGNVDSDFVGISYEKSNPSGYSDCNGLFSCGGAVSNANIINEITGSFIENNTSSDTSAAHGGAIENRGTINSINGHFFNNYAASSDTSYGGAILNATFNDYGSKIGNISGNFIGNYASASSSASGGAIYSGSMSSINNISANFIGNYVSADSYAYGGAIYNEGTIGNILGSFYGNYITVPSSSKSSGSIYGGAISNGWDSRIENIYGDFIGNHLSSDFAYTYAQGGAIYNAGNTETSGIKNIYGDFIGNYISSTITAEGGAIHNRASFIDNINSNFIGNYAKVNNEIGGDFSGSFGGAIYNSNGTIKNINGSFIQNSVASTGIYAYDTLGGAIYNVENGQIENITGDFIGNYASGRTGAKGGAIYNYSSSKVGNITGNFIRNYLVTQYSSTQGGAIYNASEATIDNITGDFIENHTGSAGEGGAIYNYNEAKIGEIKGNFIRNSASVNGGAIYNSNSAIIDDITGNFAGNYTSLNGGAIYNAYSAEIKSINADFAENYASTTDVPAYGGAIYNVSAKIGDITGDFIKNHVRSQTANAYGGAIYNVDNSEIASISGNFIENYAHAGYGASGGAIYNNDGSKIGEITGDFVKNYATAYNAGAGAIYNGFSSSIDNIIGNFTENHGVSNGGAIDNRGIIKNISGNFNKNYINSVGSYHNFGGAINNSNEIEKITADFTENYIETLYVEAKGGAIANFNTIDDIEGNFANNYVYSEGYGAYGGAIYNNENASIGKISADFIGNSSKSLSDMGLAYGGAIYNEGTLLLATTDKKKNILVQNNKIIYRNDVGAEVSKLNFMDMYSSLTRYRYDDYYKAGGSEDSDETKESILNIETIAGSSINIRDPFRTVYKVTESYCGNSIGCNSSETVETGIKDSRSTINKTGTGSLYLWGDNSEFGGTINVNEGDFAALFAEAEDLINDPLGQRQNFNLSNATINFSDGTTFRPMVTDKKIATLGGTVAVGDNVKLSPYNVSALSAGTHTYTGVDYSKFEGTKTSLLEVDTSSSSATKISVKNLAGYDGFGAAADAYRKLSTLSMEERVIYDNIYYSAKVPEKAKEELKEVINVISGGDKVIVNEVHKASVRQFSRQIYSRVQNKNCPSCGMTEGYSDEHLWFNVGKNFVDKDTNGDNIGYKYDPTSLAIGYDHDVIPNALNMGIAFSYAFGEVKGKGKSIYNTADIDEYMVSLYWKYKPLRAYMTGSLGGGYMNSDSKVKGDSIDTRGDSDTKVAFINTEFGYDFGNACGVLEPFVGFEYAYIYNSAYTEKGIGARHFASSDYNTIELPIGFRVSRNMVVDSYIVTPSIELAYSRSLGDRSSEIESYFVGSPESPWVMRGAGDSRDSLRSSMNLKINNIYSPFALNFGYARDMRSDYSDDQLYLTARYNF